MARPKPSEPKVALTISVPESLKAEFLRALEIDDKTASVVLRAAMRDYLERRAKEA